MSNLNAEYSGYTIFGSGGASSPSVSDLGWITVDLTDGSWTASDPGGVIGTSVSVASDVHTFNLNTVGVASASNNFSSTTAFTGPRWYAPLLAADGTRITSDDTFTVSIEMVEDTPANKAAVDLGFGFCVDPTSTVISNTSGIFKTGGRLFYTSGSGNPRFSGMTCLGNTGSGAGAGQKIGLTDTTVAGRRLGGVSIITLDAAGGRVADATTNNNATIPNGIDLFLIVLVGLNTNTTTITAPVDTKAKLRYRVIKWQSPPL